MASTAPSADAGDDKPPEIAPGNPTGPDPHRNIEPPAPPSAPVMSSGDGGTSVTGTTEDFYPLPLWALEERACSSCAHKKMLREKWEAARGLDPLACPRSDDGVPPSSPSAPVQGPGTEPEDPQAPPATWWCDPCEQHKKSLRDWHLRREGKLRPSPPPPPPPPPSRMPYFLPVLGSTKSIVKLGRRLQEEARRGKKRPLSVAEERGYRECDVGKKVMRHKQDGPPRDTTGLGAATRVRDALTKMMPDKRRGARRVDYSKLTPLVGSREPSFSAEDLHEGSSAQRFALHVSTEFMRLLDPQVSSSAAAGGDLDGRLDEEAIDNLLNGEGMEDIFKTSIPKAYSKEILYDLIMDCVGQYQKWLLDNRDKLDKEKYEQYLQQLVPMVDLTMVYDKEPENLSKIMKLMYKVGEYGPPPSGVIHAISPRRYQSTMEQLAAAGVVDVLHDKVPQVIKVQTEWLHEGWSAQRFALQVSTEFMQLLDPHACTSSAAAGGDLDRRLDEEAIDNLLNGEGMEDIVKTSIPKAYSKEILYDLIMECVAQYRKWLSDNRDKLDKGKYEHYLKQLVPMVQLILVYDKEPENLSKIMKLMYKVGEYGPPPSGVIHAISPHLYQSTMEQLFAAGAVDVFHDKVLQVIKAQTEDLHDGCFSQRWVGQVSTEFMRLLDPDVGSGTAAGGNLDRRLDKDAIGNLLNVEGMQDIIKTSIPKVYSKDILCELFTEYVGQYPKWLEDNKDKLDKESYDQYVKQFESMVNLTTVYNDEPENFSTIMKLIYKIGEYGPPPSGVIHAISPHLYQSTMEQLSAGMIELLQQYDKLFSVDTSPSTT